MLHDLRYALRTLRQNPGFALVAILSLALGIGASAAMFSSADALVLRPLAVPDASRIITVRSQLRGETVGGVMPNLTEASYRDYVDLRDRNHSFAGLAASQVGEFGFTTEKSATPEMKFGELVSGNFFQVLGLQPALGRGFRDEEDRVPGRDPVVVVGYDLWKNSLGSSADVIGRTVYLNGIAFTVIGVTPERFNGSEELLRSSLFIPLAMGPRLSGDLQQAMLENRGIRAMNVFGRLRAGVSVSQASAEAQGISQQLARAYPDTNRTASLVPLSAVWARLSESPLDTAFITILMALAGVVLLIACANVMNLMLSRARARSREIAVRLAIGAGRGRLVRQLLTESLVIAVAGGALGLLVAQANVDLLSQFRFPGAVPIVFDVRLDARVLLFTLAISVACALLFGLAPALKSTHPDLVPALKSGKADAGKRRRLLGRHTLVIAQVAGSLVLLVFATQAYRGMSILLAAPAGFRIDHVLMASFDANLARYSPAQTQDFYKRLLERTRALPEVKSAGLAQNTPMAPGGVGSTRVVPEGWTPPPGTEALTVPSTIVSDGYFQAIGIPIVEGREFRVTDRAGAPLVAVVNERFARNQYPKQDAVGKRFRLYGPKGPMVQIVGVAKQSKYFFIAEPPQQWIYLPQSQNQWPALTLVLETSGPAGEMVTSLRSTVRSLDPGQPMFGVMTMQEFFDQRATKTLSLLIDQVAGMGLIGLVLALVGLYGLMTYSVGLRQREIGIRMAIGADRGSVLAMVLKHGIVLAGVGVFIGLLLSFLAGKPTAALIGSSGFNVPLLLLVAFALLAVAGLGAYLPARRASLLDPNLVLRQE